MGKASKRTSISKQLIKIQEELEAEQARSRDYLNQFKYLQADFENYRKRVEKEFLDAANRGSEKLVTSLLSVTDDLERAVENGGKTGNVKALLEGVEMVYKNLRTILEREGLVEIDSVGKPFDPNLHEVLTEVYTNEYEEGIVVEEVRKGFIFKGKVLRPSVVKFACKTEKGVKK